MSEKTNWETLFDAHAPIYDENVFTKNTLNEVDFLVQELAIAPNDSILDVGCGTGRHAIELAKRGYSVTDVDISTGMLARAKAAALNAGVRIEWIHANAARFSLPREYNAAICLCEGSFGLLGVDDDPIGQPLSILYNVSRSLRLGGKTLFTVANGAQFIRMYHNSDVASGIFDPFTMTESSEMPPRDGSLPFRFVNGRSFRPNSTSSSVLPECRW